MQPPMHGEDFSTGMYPLICLATHILSSNGFKMQSCSSALWLYSTIFKQQFSLGSVLSVASIRGTRMEVSENASISPFPIPRIRRSSHLLKKESSNETKNVLKHSFGSEPVFRLLECTSSFPRTEIYIYSTAKTNMVFIYGVRAENPLESKYSQTNQDSLSRTSAGHRAVNTMSHAFHQ